MAVRPEETSSSQFERSGPEEIRSGSLVVRLAENAEEVDAALRLRYRVFYGEMSAQPSAEMERRGQDFDAYDSVADHLLVIDEDRGFGAAGVVGTYRLIRRGPAQSLGGFYSADEYDIDVLVDREGEVLELGRSCVDADYRTRRVVDMLWRGIALYLFHFDIELMFGCGSFPGADPEALQLPLSYLYNFHLAPPDLRPKAVPSRYVSMDRMPKEQVDAKAALNELPPLIKGYLRLGGFVGDGAVVDHQFNTTDVCIVVKTDLITGSYRRHYERRRTAKT